MSIILNRKIIFFSQPDLSDDLLNTLIVPAPTGKSNFIDLFSFGQVSNTTLKNTYCMHSMARFF